MEWYSMTAAEAAQRLGCDTRSGLTEAEAAKRLAEQGENSLEGKKNTSLVRKFFSQFKDFCVIILFIACVISFITGFIEKDGSLIDPIIILIIVILNAVIGVIQEQRAENSLEALRKMAAPEAVVIRSSKKQKIPSAQVVTGDLLSLESGALVPADARIITANSLSVQESALTGESEACEKNAGEVYPGDCPLAERKNMLFALTCITAGNCTAVVTDTGMNTQAGKIAGMLNVEQAPQTPLQLRLSKVGKALGVGAVAICALIFALGVFRRTGIVSSFMLSVSLAVAAIPEGLPAIVTVVLSMGVSRMAKSNAIVRRLPAVETLGAATVICSDKTGTLTENRMTVTEIRTHSSAVSLQSPQAQHILLTASLCSNAVAVKKGGKRSFVGAPTETAILEAAFNSGADCEGALLRCRRLAENPFDSTRKLMSTLNEYGKATRLLVKGAPDVLLERCDSYESDGVLLPLTASKRQQLIEANHSMAGRALRVIAVGWREVGDGGTQENGLAFLGLIGMYDPPRREALSAVKTCKQAGIRPVMITGDHISTATAIASQLGIADSPDCAVTGSQLEAMNDSELAGCIDKLSVFARVTPEHKVRIVKVLRAKGEIVAMTGDGVNDAPALKAADIGCAMGRGGTEVAKNAADMILTDDNFATIVRAVKQGRCIYANIRKAVHFLLSTNIGEIVVVFLASLCGLPSPLLAIQLLWVNLVTDSLPAIALGVEPAEDNIMRQSPVPPHKGFFSDGLWLDIILEGFLAGILALLAFGIGRFSFGGENLALGRTMAFTTLSLCEIVYAFVLRSERSLFKIGLFSNKRMTAAIIVSTLLQLSVVLIAPLAGIFSCVPMKPIQWLIVLLIAFVPFTVSEISKIGHR